LICSTAGIADPPQGTASQLEWRTLEQAIAHNLESLFPGIFRNIIPSWITRDTDLALEEDEADDLLGDRAGTHKRRLGGSTGTAGN